MPRKDVRRQIAAVPLRSMASIGPDRISERTVSQSATDEGWSWSMTQAPVLAAGEHTMTVEERRNQRNAVLAGFLGWTLDAFDYFVLTFVIADIARSFGKTTPDIALTLTLALATRPLGAIIFGIVADRYGRRLPLMINVICY